MRAQEFITENSTDSILAEIAKIYKLPIETVMQMKKIAKKGGMQLNVIEWAIQISQKCQPFIRQVGWDNCFKLYRGVNGKSGWDYIDGRVRLEGRTPNSMDPYLHDNINKYFKDMYGAPFRDSMLCTGDPNHASIFGPVFMVFPIGDFKFLWNEKVDDFNFALSAFMNSDRVKNNIEGSAWSSKNRDMINDWFFEEFVKETAWHSIDLNSAIEAQSEVMIRPEQSKQYYGISYRKFGSSNNDYTNTIREIMKLAV